jgi:hypothetical protein
MIKFIVNCDRCGVEISTGEIKDANSSVEDLIPLHTLATESKVGKVCDTCYQKFLLVKSDAQLYRKTAYENYWMET